MRRILLALPLLGLTACTGAGVRTVTSEAAPARAFDNLAVVADWRDQRVRGRVEARFAMALGAVGRRSVDTFPPGRGYSRDEIAAALAAGDLDGALIVSLTDARLRQVADSLPADAAAQGIGSSAASGARMWTPGLQTRFTAVLVDASLAIVWQASTDPKPGEFASFEQLVGALADYVAGELGNRGLITAE